MAEEGGAKLIDGKKVAEDIRREIKENIAKIQESSPDFKPGLAVIQVGDRDDSNVYVRNKIKFGEEVGMKANHFKLPRTTTQAELLAKINEINRDNSFHGLIVQLPLESDHQIDVSTVTNAVSPLKDVDGLNEENAGKLARGEIKKCFIPCTPRGCLELIKRAGVDVDGKDAVVIGRSKIVGAPMSDLLLWNHATVTTCHSHTKDIAEVASRADVLVVAAGKPLWVKKNWVKPGAVVIDCGIGFVPDATKKSGRRMVGDVDFPEVKQVASHITPVPGGVGPMTVSMLLLNTFDSAKRTLQNQQVSRPKPNGFPLHTTQRFLHWARRLKF